MKKIIRLKIFVNHQEPKVQVNKAGISFRFYFNIIVENCLLYDALHDFSVWLRIGSNPVDINQFRSHTAKNYTDFFVFEINYN